MRQLLHGEPRGGSPRAEPTGRLARSSSSSSSSLFFLHAEFRLSPLGVLPAPPPLYLRRANQPPHWDYTSLIAALAEGKVQHTGHVLSPVMFARRARTPARNFFSILFSLLTLDRPRVFVSTVTVSVGQRLVFWESSQRLCSCCPPQHGLCGRMTVASVLEEGSCTH